VTVRNGVALSVSSVALANIAKAGDLEFPRTVGGEALPDTGIAKAAVKLGRGAMPPYLFNHCMRTYLFGAMSARLDGLSFDEEMIFVAAALHDMGLIEQYSSKDLPFEMDSADAAKRFLEAHGVKGARIDLVWNAVAMHSSVLVAHQPAQTALVARGAAADVVGSGVKGLPQDKVQEALSAFPRLGFKSEFEGLLLDYCRRKPFAQIGTWTDDFCRRHNHDVQFPMLERRIDQSPFPD
jgi:hypothetical protein